MTNRPDHALATVMEPGYGYGYPSYPQGPGGGGGLGPTQILKVLLSRWWLILICIALVGGAAWYIIPEDRTAFRAGAVVLLDDPRTELTGGLAGVETDTRSTEYMLSQLHIIRSEGLLTNVVEQLGLRLWPSGDLPWSTFQDVLVTADATASGDTVRFQFDADGVAARTRGGASVRASYGEPLVLPQVTVTVPARPSSVIEEGRAVILSRMEAVARVTGGLGAAPRERTAILDISYQDSDGSRAVAVVNAVADAYRTFNSAGVLDQARIRREFLEERLIEADGALARSQENLRAFQSIDREFATQERLAAERSTLLALDSQRRQLEEERRIYESFLQRVSQLRDDALDAELRTLMATPSATASPLLSQLYTQLVGYQTERQGLIASGLATTHPQVQRVDALIETVRASIAQGARTQLMAVDLRIEGLDDQLTRASATLRSLPQTTTEEARLIDEVESARATVASLRAQYQSARLAESLEVSQVQIIDVARFPIPTTVGNRQRSLMIALIFGFLLGGGSAMLIEVTNRSVRRRDEGEDLLSLPALGVIPKIGSRGEAAYAPTLKKGRGRQLPVPSGSANGSSRSYGSRAGSVSSYQSIAAEAYRMLRTNLVFLTPGRELRSIMVTSASSGEGKTTTAANLAVSFARQGKRVLLVDADLRRPKIHELFQVGLEPGFTDLLLGRATLGEAIRPTDVERLFIIPRGTFDEDALEVLSGGPGQRVISALKENADLVIFDTSPVLLTADAAAIAPNTDGALLVVRAGNTTKEAARQAHQHLLAVGSGILGFVLNDPDSVGDKYGEYKYTKTYYAVEA